MMKKKLPKTAKIGLIVFGALLLMYVSFCITDCIRLRKAKMYTEPLITLSVTEDDKGYTYYKGLGYTMIYSNGEREVIDEHTVVVTGWKSAEFVWLGRTVWGWWL